VQARRTVPAPKFGGGCRLKPVPAATKNDEPRFTGLVGEKGSKGTDYGTSLNQADDENDYRDDEENVNEAVQRVARDQAQEPENQKDDENGPQHDVVPSYRPNYREAALGPYSEARANVRGSFEVRGVRKPLVNPELEP
jgi:hypothetical protein